MQKILGYALIVLSVILIMSFLTGIHNFINSILSIILLFSGKLTSEQAGELTGRLVFQVFHIFLIVITMKYGRKLIK